LKLLLPAIPGVGNDIKKPGEDEVCYDRTPLKAMASQLEGWRATADDLGKVTAPLLVLRATDDHLIDATSLGLIRAGVSSEVAEYVTLENSYHVATIDNDAELIFERSAAFIHEHAGARDG
jgi:carboxylesterase